MGATPQTVLPCGQCWIEIELLDEDGAPVAREPYWIKLPNGEVREGRLDSNGLARFNPIPCGTCIVRFPRNRDDELRLVVSRSKEDHWIELHLLDEDGDPVKLAEYAVTLPDSSKRDGTLDVKGYARLEGIPEGVCRVTFPEFDKAEIALRASRTQTGDDV